MSNGDDIVQTIKIEVDDEQLQKLGDSAKESIDKLTEQTDKATESLGKLGDKAGDTGKELEKIGDGADESIGKVTDKSDDAKEALEKLAESGKHTWEDIENGAKQAGVSLEDFAKLSESTQDKYIEFASRVVDANKDIGDSMKGIGDQGGGAKEGLGQMGQGLDQVTEKSGISGRELRGLSKIMSAFGAGEIAHVVVGIGRVATSLGVLGAAVLALGLGLTYLYKTAEAVKKIADEAENLSKVTANTPQQLEQMMTAFEKAGGKAKEFADYIKDVVLEMSRLEKEKGMTPEQIKSMEDAANNADKLKKQFTDLIQGSKEWSGSFDNIAKAIKNTIDPMVDAGKAGEALKKALHEIPGVMKDGKVDFEAYDKAMRKLYNSMDDFGKLRMEEIWRAMKVPDATIQSWKQTQEEADKLKKKFEDKAWQRDLFKDFAKGIDDLKGELGTFGTDLGAYFLLWLKAFGKFMHDIEDLARAGKLGEAFMGGLKMLGEDIAGLAEKLWQSFKHGFLDPIKEGFGNLGEIIKDFFSNLPSMIGEAAQKLWQSFKEGFLDPIKEAFDTIVEWVGQKAKEMIDAVAQAWQSFKDLVNDYIIQPVKDAWNAVVDYVKEKADAAYKAVQDAWKDFKQWCYDTFVKPVKDAWDQAVDYISGKVDQVIGYLRSIKQAALDAWNAIKGMFGAGAGEGGGRMARGGLVSGAGSSTSDSIPAWLSAGEFVVRASAVQAYGLHALHAINSMTAPRFAAGGLAIPIPKSPSPSGSGQRTLTLNIEGRSFQGLQVPERTAQSLERFAVHSQIASAGRKQSWRR